MKASEWRARSVESIRVSVSIMVYAMGASIKICAWKSDKSGACLDLSNHTVVTSIAALVAIDWDILRRRGGEGGESSEGVHFKVRVEIW
jgi:hypothetical protein